MFASERLANLVVAPIEKCQDVWRELPSTSQDAIDADIEERGGAAEAASELMPEICGLLFLERRGGLEQETAAFYARLVARVRLLGEETPGFVGPGSELMAWLIGHEVPAHLKHHNQDLHRLSDVAAHVVGSQTYADMSAEALASALYALMSHAYAAGYGRAQSARSLAFQLAAES
jgi:hypothetical protein